MKKNYEMDMCNGPLFGKILIFAIPLILSGMLQLLFNAADVIVVGHYAGSDALAAVGSTNAFINLLINLFIGISVGANVMTARFYGSGDEKAIYETVHTAVLLALAGGLTMMVVGMIIAKPVLTLMGTPAEVLPYSVLYMRIYFIGMPALVLYNFGAAILRAVGDTRRPLYFLTAAGVVNVIFNLIFVIVFHMGVAGVAIATAISQFISASLVLFCLCRSEGVYRLKWKELHIYGDKMKSMIQIGLPAGLQSAAFNLSNMLVQSSVNSFGHLAMAGNTAANNIDGFLNITANAINQTAVSFMSQNMGAKKYGRMDKVLLECLAFIGILGGAMGFGAYLIAPQLLHIYSPDAEVVKYGIIRMSFICAPYAICGMQDVMGGGLRGSGYSLAPTIISLTGACLFRIIWIFTAFRMHHSLYVLYVSYPISWSLTGITHGICYLVMRRRRLKYGM